MAVVSISDTRIGRYRSAIHALQEGQFEIALGAGPDDSLGLLGRDLNQLAIALRRRFDEVSALLSLSDRVGSGLFLEDVLNGIYDSFREIVPYDRIGCALLDRTRTRVVARWARSTAPRLLIQSGYERPLAGSTLAAIIRSGQPRIINDLEQHLAAHPDSEATRLMLAEGIHASLTCPLVAQGVPVGFLFFSSNQRHAYGEAHKDVIHRLAAQLSVVIERSVLYEDMHELNQRLRAAQQTLEIQASTDSLTGLLNRRAVLARLDAQVATLARGEAGLALCMIDVDHFKRVNDTFGHLAGDEVLRQVGNTLQLHCRKDGALGRYGGEEFLYVLPAAGRADAEIVAQRLRAALAELAIPLDGVVLHVTASIGITTAAAGAQLRTDDLIAAADAALYAAKGLGRDRCEFRPSRQA
jgi:diguanylate cyclase (GGDEF)-like protein